MGTDTRMAAEMDPAEPLTITVCHQPLAGKKTSTRFGQVTFDDKGFSQVKVTAGDLMQLDRWGWLTKEDQDRLFPKAAEPEPEPAKGPSRSSGRQEMQDEIVDLRRELLATKEQWNEEVDALREQNSVLSTQLSEVTAKLEAAQNELAAIQEHVPTTEDTPKQVAASAAEEKPKATSNTKKTK